MSTSADSSTINSAMVWTKMMDERPKCEEDGSQEKKKKKKNKKKGLGFHQPFGTVLCKMKEEKVV